MSACTQATQEARRAVIIDAIIGAVREQMDAGLIDELQLGLDERGLFMGLKGDILLAPLADAILKEIAPLA